MKSITKQELISNLQDKISQFKSNFSKIKESRKEVPELNFEINRDALKLFYKNKSDNEVENQIPLYLNIFKIKLYPFNDFKLILFNIIFISINLFFC